jgi:hypothetical protein
MSLRYRKYTNLNGQQVEFASELILPQARYSHREAKSQKAQLKSDHPISGNSKDRKRPIKYKLT